MLYKIVDLYFEINTKYDYSKERLCDYETDEKRTPDLVIEISDEEITNEEKNNPGFNNPYYEFICILRRVVDFVIDYDSLFVHSALISFDDDGYLFLGRSGVGKSTHVSLWKKHFGDRVRIINADKPIVRFYEDEIIGFGTPWCGKELWGENKKVPIKALCFLEQSDDNQITELDKKEAFSLILNQVEIPKDMRKKIKFYDLLDKLLSQLPIYQLKCNISKDAVVTAYNKFRGE